MPMKKISFGFCLFVGDIISGIVIGLDLFGQGYQALDPNHMRKILKFYWKLG